MQRSLKFVRYLRDFGYECTVVTGPEAERSRWTPVDETLEHEIPAGTRVVRLASGPPPAGGTWRRRARRWLGARTPFAEWWIEGSVKAGRAVKADLIYASLSPYESADAALRLAEELDIPWVADLRDPWALDEMVVYPSRLHRWWELRRMRAVLARADAVIMNTEEAARRLRALSEFVARDVSAIPNGFDPDDFAGPPPPPHDSQFRIVHAGYLHTELGRKERSARLARRLLGGSAGGVDILTRSHVYLVEAIERVRAKLPDAGSRIELHLAGVLSTEDREAGAAAGMHEHGYLSHPETVALMRSADLLFLPMHDLPSGRRSGIVPGKTYEYLASRRPILAAVPDGDARDLLERAGSAFLCRPRAVECMARVIEAELDRKERAETPQVPDADVLRPFERRELARRLAEVFDRLGDARSSSPDGPPSSPARVPERLPRSHRAQRPA